MTADNDIVLYDYWRSSAGYRLRIALNIKGLAYRRVAVNLARGEQHAAAHLARDPLGRVPVLSLAGRTLTQSFAMLEYLEEAYPTPPLLPADAPARARVRALSLVVVADIHPIGNSGTMAHVDTLFPLDKNAWQAHFIGQGFAAVEAILAAAPASKFCHGDTPGIADCCLIPQIYNANRWGVSLTPYPRIRAINAAANTLPAFQNAHPDNLPDNEKV